MLELIRDVVQDVIEAGYLANYVYGTKEQTTAEDAVLFRFDIPIYTLNPDTKLRDYTLKYIVSQPSQQNENDFVLTSKKIEYCEKVNQCFMDKLLAWENDDGQQLIEVTELIRVTPFADLTILQHPATGVLVEMRLTELAPIHCIWK